MGLTETIDRALIKALPFTRLKAVTFRRVSGGQYDPTSGQVIGATTTDYQVKGVLGGYSLAELAASAGQLERGDRFLLLSAAGLPGQPDLQTDSIVVDGQTWRPVALEPIGVVEARLYKLQLRRV